MNRASWQFTPFLIPILGAAVVLTFLSIYAWRRRQSAQGTGAFVALLSLTAWWCYTYAAELITTDPAVMLLLVKLEWISIALLPVAWFVFALYYAGYPQHVTLRNLTLLAIIPAIVLTLAWTTPAHSLIYANPGITTDGALVFFSAERGIGFYLNVVYSYVLILIATVLILLTLRRSTGQRRRLAAIVAIGALLPFIGNAVYQVALLTGFPLYVDLTVPAFAFSAILFTWGWFGMALFDIVPELGEPALQAADMDPAIAAQNTQERTLNLVSLGLALLFFVALVPILTIVLRGQPQTRPLGAVYVALFVLTLAVAVWRKGPYTPRALGLVAVYLGLAVLDLRVSGLTPVLGSFIVAFAGMAAVLLPGRTALLTLLGGLVVILAVPPTLQAIFERDIVSLAYLVLSLIMTAGLLLLAVVTLRRDSRILLRHSRQLSDELAVERAQLEQRVVERTLALETAAVVSRRLSTILDQPRLVREVVEQLRTAFSYYHVHIYFWDGESGLLKMVGGTGEAGQAMLVAGHALYPAQGLVGRAFTTNDTVIVPDVSLNEFWLPNRLLPGTKAEIAVPVTYGDEVLGVLDVQEDEAGGLGPQDAQLLQTIAGQLAVALRNARLVTQIQHEAEQEALINTISRKIVQTTDIDGAMNVALAELTQALQARRARARLTLEGETNGHGR
jgi:putative methionine-R-sulfoxide reductase with GAF domain